MGEKIRVTEETMEFVQRLTEVAGRIAIEMELTTAEQTQGAAVYAGIVAKCNAAPGQAAIVGMVSAQIVMQLAGGAAQTVN